MAKSAKSAAKQLVVLVAASVLVWAAAMAIHDHLPSTVAEATSQHASAATQK
ncbi:MAG: hypothetical protein WAK55_17680 [Xanthobacteraceae bacterium]